MSKNHQFNWSSIQTTAAIHSAARPEQPRPPPADHLPDAAIGRKSRHRPRAEELRNLLKNHWIATQIYQINAKSVVKKQNVHCWSHGYAYEVVNKERDWWLANDA